MDNFLKLILWKKKVHDFFGSYNLVFHYCFSYWCLRIFLSVLVNCDWESANTHPPFLVREKLNPWILFVFIFRRRILWSLAIACPLKSIWISLFYGGVWKVSEVDFATWRGMGQLYLIFKIKLSWPSKFNLFFISSVSTVDWNCIEKNIPWHIIKRYP